MEEEDDPSSTTSVLKAHKLDKCKQKGQGSYCNAGRLNTIIVIESQDEAA